MFVKACKMLFSSSKTTVETVPCGPRLVSGPLSQEKLSLDLRTGSQSRYQFGCFGCCIPLFL